MTVGLRAFSMAVALAFAMAAGPPAGADGLDAELFQDLIPGQPVSPQELEELLGRGVNERGSVRLESTQSESASSYSETVESSRSSSITSTTTSIGSRSLVGGAATSSAGGRVGGQSRLQSSPGASSPGSRSFRSPSGNLLRGPSVRTTTQAGGRF
jgi:hypothetical protein